LFHETKSGLSESGGDVVAYWRMEDRVKRRITTEIKNVLEKLSEYSGV
jgi:hypothetical protein